MKRTLSATRIVLALVSALVLVAGCSPGMGSRGPLRPTQALHTASITAEPAHERIIGLAEEEELHSLSSTR